MDTKSIIKSLKAERTKIDKAIALLEETNTTELPSNGAPKRRRRLMSKAARAKISAAQKKRWAEKKKA